MVKINMSTQYDRWIELADLNLAAVIKSRMQTIPNAKLFEHDGQIAFSIGRQALDGHLNGMFRYNHCISTENTIEYCNHFLQLIGFGFIIWIRDHADNKLEILLQNSGLTPLRKPGSAGMTIESPLALPEISDSLQIKKVSTKEDVADFNSVIAASFGIPLETSKLAIGQFNQLTNSNVAAFVIREQDQPMAAGMVVLEQGIAGIYYIGTIPQARGRGLGDLCTRIATNAGFDLGACAVILQASSRGESLYRRLGFKTITHYRWYPFTAPIV